MLNLFQHQKIKKLCYSVIRFLTLKPVQGDGMKLIECHEPLVDLRRFCPGVVIRLNKERRAEKTAYVRRTVALMLKRAKKLLPRGMTFVIRDAWRPAAVQKKIMQDFVLMFRRRHPTWSAARALREADKFVASSRGPKVSGHMTGGAVDVRLLKNGKLLPMRSWKLSYQENAAPCQPKLPKHLQANREIMFSTLRAVGFSQCHNEFWHWSYGDVQWAQRTGKKVAMFGVIAVNKKSA